VSAGPAATYYNCTAVDTWTATGGSGTFSALSGDATSTATGGATTVSKFNGGTAFGSAAAGALVTTVGSPGSDTNVASEKAVRTALGAVSGGGSVFTGSTATATTGITGTAAVPILSLSDQSVKSPVRFEITLTASTNVTGVTVNNKTAGAKFSVVWTQPASNMDTVTWGGSVANTPCTISAAASAKTEQSFEVAADGATVYTTGCVDITDAPITGGLRYANGASADTLATMAQVLATCTTCLAVSAPAVHSILLGAGTQVPAVAGPNAATTYPLFSAGTGADPAFRAIAGTDLPATNLPTPGTGVTIALPHGYAICTGTCTVTLPAPTAAGDDFCVWNDVGVATAITITGVTNVYFSNVALSAYGTISGSFTATAVAGNSVCMVARDTTHWHVKSYTGVWTAN
jgi:hypothetical protein